MIIAFTLVAAIAQPLFKTGANRLLRIQRSAASSLTFH